MKTFGVDWEVICERRRGGRPPLTESEFAYEVTEEGAVLVDTRYRMKGEDVFNFAAREVPAALRCVLEFAGRDLESIDAVVLHQANRMINEFIRKRLRIAPERLPSSLADFGNTSSASIPLTIVARLRERMEGRPHGAGAMWVRRGRLPCCSTLRDRTNSVPSCYRGVE